MRFWLPFLLLATLAACADNRDPARYQFGVSGARMAGTASAENDQKMRAFLDVKARQICTLGYNVVKAETLAAEDNEQIVALDLSCKQYRPDFVPGADMLSGIVY